MTAFVYGQDANAISEPAKRGEILFFNDGTAGCFRCHNGFNFTDGRYHNTGLYNPYLQPNLGTYEHTRKTADLGKFKTPSLCVTWR